MIYASFNASGDLKNLGPSLDNAVLIACILIGLYVVFFITAVAISFKLLQKAKHPLDAQDNKAMTPGIIEGDFVYPIGRAFPIFFISFFLGGVWGVTAVAILGIVTLALNIGAIGWHLLVGGTLVLSLYFVQKIAGRRMLEDADITEIKWNKIDKVISSFGFAGAYILAWIMIREIIHVAMSIVV